MGCVPSKSSSTVHPAISEESLTVPIQELPEPPNSTSEHVNKEQSSKALVATELHDKFPNHVSQNASKQSIIGPIFQRQSAIMQCEDVTDVNTDDQENRRNHPNMEISDLEEPTPSVSNMPNEQSGRPSWSREKAYHHCNPTLRLYGTNSQIEFFKMLDKKIEEGPDFHEKQDGTS